MRTIAILALVSLATSGALAKKEITQAAVQPRELSLVRVNVTGQGFDYFRPWQKRAPFSKRALGAVLSQGRVLVTADLVANQNYVELERAESGEKSAASVEVVDYEANLALLQPQDKKFLSGLAPLELANDTIVGDRLAALQLEQTGALVVTDGLLTAVQVTRYPADVAQFLTYRLSIALQYRDNSYTVPLVKNNKLAGLLLRYDPRSQLMDVIPTPIIAHFLKDASKPNYPGFPSIGFSYFPTRDPQLRKYSGENGNGGGVYITGVEPGTAAQKAGLQVGDIVKSIGTSELDQNGNYVDSLYKKMDFTNLLTLRQYCGDKVPLKVLRQGKPLELSLNLEHRGAPADYVIPPYPQDEAPKYYILGGLIFQELTRQYLREWGANWLKDAPQRFVYLDRYQWELFPEGHQRVVILSQILPVNSTIGYDDGYLTVSKVNGKEIRSLNDLAEAVNQPVNGFYKIETVEDPKQFELDAAQVRADEPNLRENYGIPALQRLN